MPQPKGAQQFFDKPFEIEKEFKDLFICGKDFTIFGNKKDDSIKVVGSKVFKKQEYKLPFKPKEIKAGEGIVVISGKK